MINTACSSTVVRPVLPLHVAVVTGHARGMGGSNRVPSCIAEGCSWVFSAVICLQKLNFFGGPALTTEAEARLELDQVDHEEDRMVFLANVWLDRSETFEALHTLFSGVLAGCGQQWIELGQQPGMLCLFCSSTRQ